MKQKEKIALLKKARKTIQALDDKRYKLFGKVCDKLKVDEDGDDTIFDYLFNNFGDVKQIARKL